MKTILLSTLLNMVVYIVIYMIRTYVIWEFRNPFEWILNIPDYSYDTRGQLLCGFVVYYFMLVSASQGVIEKLKQKKDERKQIDNQVERSNA